MALKNPPAGWTGPTRFTPGGVRDLGPDVMPGKYSNGFAGLQEFLGDVKSFRAKQASAPNTGTPTPSLLAKVR